MTSPLQAMMTLLIMCLMTLSAVQACETEDGQPILQCITPTGRTCDLTLDQNGEHECLPCLYPPKNGATLPSCQRRAANASASNSGNLNTFGCATDNLIATCLTTKQKNHVNNLLEETDANPAPTTKARIDVTDSAKGIIPLNPAPTTKARIDVTEDSESISMLVIILIVVGLVGLGVIFAFFIVQKRKLEEDEDDFSSLDATSLDIPDRSLLSDKNGITTAAPEEAPTTTAKSKSKSKGILPSFLKPKVSSAEAATKAEEGCAAKVATKNKWSQMFRSNKETAVPKEGAEPKIPAAAKPEMSDPESPVPTYIRSRTSSIPLRESSIDGRITNTDDFTSVIMNDISLVGSMSSIVGQDLKSSGHASAQRECSQTEFDL